MVIDMSEMSGLICFISVQLLLLDLINPEDFGFLSRLLDMIDRKDLVRMLDNSQEDGGGGK